MRVKTLIAASVGLAAFGHAQDGLPPAFQNLPLDNMMLDAMQRNMGSGLYAKSGRAKVRRPHPVAKESTTFRIDPAVTQSTLARFAAWARKSNPKAAAELMGAYAKESPAHVWQALVGRDGVRANDLADVYGEYWSTMWSLATGKSKSSLAVRGLVEQFRPMLASPRRPLTDAEKQSMAEGIMLDQIQTTFWIVRAVKRNDRAALSQASDSAAQAFRKNFGLNARTLQLTPSGFTRA